MSHEIETTAWANEKPWHGLGVQVAPTLSAAEMLKAAKLNWTVEKQPLFFQHGQSDVNPSYNEVDDHYALVRSSDKSVLDVVGNQYVPVQNKEAFQFFHDFVKAGKMKMETAGSLKGGRIIWGLAAIGNDFTLTGNDKVKGYILLASPHQQGRSMRIKFTAVRVVCNNTLTLSLNEDQLGFRMVHRQAFDESMIAKAKDALGIANEHLDALADKATILSKKKVKDPLPYFTDVFTPDLPDAPVNELKQSKPVKLAMEALTHAPGSQLQSSLGTAWGALNAVTYVTDHLLGRTADARVSKAWFGRTEAIKNRALELALSL